MLQALQKRASLAHKLTIKNLTRGSGKWVIWFSLFFGEVSIILAFAELGLKYSLALYPLQYLIGFLAVNLLAIACIWITGYCLSFTKAFCFGRVSL
jgi:hypothetical protein